MEEPKSRKTYRDEINAFFNPSEKTLKKIEALFNKPIIVTQVKHQESPSTHDSSHSEMNEEDDNTKV